MNRVLLKHISIIGLHFGPMRKREPEAVREVYRALSRLYVEGKIAPLVSRTFPLEQAAEALDLLAGRQSVGKVVLTV